jgi:hypothetical protein
MTSTVITDEMVDVARTARSKAVWGTAFAGDNNKLSLGDSDKASMRAALLAAAPMILDEVAKVAYPDPLYMAGNDRDENGNLAPGSPYDRGRYDAAKDIRALKDPRP